MNDTEFREAVEQAHELQELTRHPGWQTLLGYMQATSLGKRNALLNGGVRDMEDYKHACGWLAGAEAVLSAPTKVLESVNNERERRAEVEE